MATEKVILIIETSDLTAINSKQIGSETVNDADLNFPMIGVKSAAGVLHKLISKGNPALLAGTTIDGDLTVAAGCKITLCATGTNPASAGSIQLSIGPGGELLQEVVS